MLNLDVARTGLIVGGEQASIVSRNIANVGNGLYSRKSLQVISAPNGGARVVGVTRASNDALTNSIVRATSDAADKSAVVAALDQLNATVTDPELDASVAARIGKLNQALQTFATLPNDTTAAIAAVEAARDVVTALHEASGVVQQVRQQADADLVTSVDRVNDLLVQFAKVNRAVVVGTRNGTDVTDYLDQRDELVRQISTEVGVRPIVRGDYDMVLFTDSGLTLFDNTARTVTLQPTFLMPPGSSGNAVFIDGVPVTGTGSTLAVNAGRIHGLSVVRDELSVAYEGQLDEIARGLIEAFAESDQSAAPALPDLPGLFTYPGAPAMPATGTLISGLAASIRLNANVDRNQGGNPLLLRDGSIADPGNVAYTYNNTGAAGFSARIEQLMARMDTARPFDTTTDMPASATLLGASSASAGWLQAARKAYADESEYRTTLLERSREALSRETGVNLDEEMAMLLEVERAYQTSSKIIATIDNMLMALLNAS